VKHQEGSVQSEIQQIEIRFLAIKQDYPRPDLAGATVHRYIHVLDAEQYGPHGGDVLLGGDTEQVLCRKGLVFFFVLFYF
jgi:hypothetical protein